MKRRKAKIKEEEKSFDKEKSTLPKWLLDRGLQSTWGIPNVMGWLTKQLASEQKKIGKLQKSYNNIKSKLADKDTLKSLKETLGKEIYFTEQEIKRFKKEIKDFEIDHFHAVDVEEAWRR